MQNLSERGTLWEVTRLRK